MSASNPVEVPALHPAARDLIMEFPLPLALLGPGGTIDVANDNFTHLFDIRQLTPEHLRPVLARPGEKDKLLTLPGLDGHEIQVRARSAQAHNGLLLVIDEVPAIEISLEIEHLNQRILELEKLSATDRLTGAWNRAHLDRIVESELGRSLRARQPVSLILLDIDHFKSVNDTFGHQAGDSVLCELVAVVTAGIRSADTLFRWGGEEFVVLAAGAGYRNAEGIAETLRRRVEAHSFAIAGRVTVSLGVAEHTGAESTGQWFRRVDAALYAAKEGGRNRVSVDRQGSSDLWAAAGGLSALKLVWSEAYECGEPTIDREHRELFDLANALIDVSLAGEKDPDKLPVALDRLLAHIAGHFADEEALLEQHHYVNLAAHKRAHAGLLARAQELKLAVAAGTATLGGLIEFIANDVVARHLFTADREFFSLFAIQ